MLKISPVNGALAALRVGLGIQTDGDEIRLGISGFICVFADDGPRDVAVLRGALLVGESTGGAEEAADDRDEVLKQHGDSLFLVLEEEISKRTGTSETNEDGESRRRK